MKKQKKTFKKVNTNEKIVISISVNKNAMNKFREQNYNISSFFNQCLQHFVNSNFKLILNDNLIYFD